MAIKEPTTVMDWKSMAGSATPVYLRDAIHAGRADAVVCGWINAQAGLNALTVINNNALYYNIPDGMRVMAAIVCAGLNTNGDEVMFQLGYTNQINAGGNFTPVMPYKRYATGAAREGRLDYELIPPIPMVIRHSDGARCVTMRVQANDAAAEVDLAWQGWIEREHK